MKYCPSINACFIHVFKTGGTSISRALEPYAEDDIPWKQHAPANCIKAVLNDWDDLFTFAFVRNSWDWVYSHYLWCLQRGRILGQEHDLAEQVRAYGSLKVFVQEGLVGGGLPFANQRQVDWIRGWDGKTCLSFVGRFENLHQDWNWICHALGIHSPLPHENKTDRVEDYRTVYDDETADLVAKHFAPDINEFNFSF